MQRLLRYLLPVLVLIGAVAAARSLMLAKPQVAARPQAKRELPVTVLRAQPTAHPISLQALGEVKPVHRLVVQPEVSGRIVERSASLLPGGLLHKGDPLIRVDNRDHATVVAAQAAALEQATAALVEERGRKQVAEYDWQANLDKLSEDARAFALRESHGRSAQASLSSARAQFDKARRDLGRTQVKVPFDALVLEATAELGQLVTPQTALATLVAIDRYWVEVAVPVSQLIHFEIPGVNVAIDARGSAAKILLDAGGGVVIERDGVIERLLGQVDARGRMARVLVMVEDPLGVQPAALKAAPEQSGPRATLPLLLGSYVRVQIAGAPLPDTTEIPRVALVDDHAVWLVVDDKLTAREVEVAWRGVDTVLVRGLRPGEPVVTTPLASPTEGMAVRIEGESPALIAASAPARP
ncbi:HlyD family efflux transporter periplasmic adaptor subunit [Nannocystis sp.]|uniref:efflux RND transporter periplasmic adaptor subunit n=1 Tax=Nannocystis sp. TaxID=1962667 RepID=UPI0025EC325B|nr:HlyD family efflux transporter periplasmic adaptor subunit [Nannocystis sp.]MBK7829240.1 HlyD family efflux transporter periplasmic adaptor subunit [Nannocystis sp.]